jgi:disulfide oxidoreductase YuzD
MKVFKIKFKNCGYIDELEFKYWEYSIFFTKYGNVLITFEVKYKDTILENIKEFIKTKFPNINIDFKNVEIIVSPLEYKHYGFLEKLKAKIINYFKIRKFKKILEKDRSLFVMDLYTNNIYEVITGNELCNDFKVLKIEFENI